MQRFAVTIALLCSFRAQGSVPTEEVHAARTCANHEDTCNDGLLSSDDNEDMDSDDVSLVQLRKVKAHSMQAMIGVDGKSLLDIASPELGWFESTVVPKNVPTVKEDFQCDSNTAACEMLYLVAMTDDGGPFATLHDRDHEYAKPGLARIRNFHESLCGSPMTQCMHWQTGDGDNADWVHQCASILGVQEWVKGKFVTQPSASAAAPLALVLKHFFPLPSVQLLYCGVCDGTHLKVNLLDLPDSKGVEVLSVGKPALSNDCFAMIQEKVTGSWGLDDTYRIIRANTDLTRDVEDFAEGTVG